MARRKHRRRSFGVLLHRGASQANIPRGGSSRRVSVNVWIHRERGAARAGQFCAFAVIPRNGTRASKVKERRAHGYTCGPTPTIAMKRALRVFVGRNWTR